MDFEIGTNTCHPEDGVRRISKKNKQKILRFAQNDIAFGTGINTCHPEGGARRISKKNEQKVFRFVQNDKKCAFTMAEVLITLGIIGIVAAMTLPSVINNIKNKQHEARFKKAYSVLYQAVLQMGNENPALWQTYCGNGQYDSDYSFITDFSKQFKVLKLQMSYTQSLKDIGYKQQNFYRSQSGKLVFNPDSHDNGAFITQDGMIVFSSGCWWDDGLDFVVDTNGHRGPNKFGYDVFYFQISKNNQLLPSSINETFSNVGSQKAGGCAFDGNVGGIPVNDNGAACSRFALMDRFPSDESKSYWKNLPPP